jgi:glycosyltransferase involved in cell wall biosynthesis
LGLGETVRFLGYVSEEEKIRLLRTSWVHVLTSPKEGWGISALEAAACGTPTVASDSPGLRDAVQDGETGVLVPHGSVESLVSALENLIESNVRRKEMGEKARCFAEAYSWERSARQMLAILEDRVAQGHPPQ